MKFAGYIFCTMSIFCTVPALAICDYNYYSSAKKAEERRNKLLTELTEHCSKLEEVEKQPCLNKDIKISVIPGDRATPCRNSDDQFFIEVNGNTLNEGDKSALGVGY